ncbi:MAG: DUF5723 family protein [Bacteroidaceae bacterium]|nr:DUF5723 family protein [Bacteroidaceae bacterium]
MKATIRLALAAVILLASGTAMAQNLRSSYFMEGSLFRHELNPAFEATQSYVSMPALGNFGLSVNGNFGMQDIMFNRNGKTVTYLHPDVSVADALSGLNDNNKLIFNINEQILGLGFRGFGGYNTIGLNLRSTIGANLPYEIFELTKNLQNKSYDVSDVNFFAQAYVELALGHSHQVGDALRIGGKLKFLFGGGRFNADLKKLTLDLQSDSRWVADAEAEIVANVKGLVIPEKTEEYENRAGTYKTVDFDNIDVDGAGLGGFGLALDLGAEYDFDEILPGFKASLALNDLGYINWSETHTIVNNGKQFVFDGFENIKVEDGEGTKMSDQADELVDDLTDLYRLQTDGETGSSSYGIGTTLNIGVEYAIPGYDKLRFGLLSSTRFQGKYGWNEERLSVNFAPAKWFEMNVNGGVGTFGASFGWMLNVHPVGFNFFVGMDHMLGSVSKEFVPLNSNASFCMGVNFPLTKVKKQAN